MTTAQIIAALAINAAIEDQLKKELQEREECQKKDELLKKLIGKKYVPQDNSYIHEIVNGKRRESGYLIGVPCEIISKPYIITISNGYTKPYQRRMIRVKSLRTGFIYEVMFAESWIQD
jgi:hypothetical protein